MKLAITVEWPEKVLWSNGSRGHHRYYAREAMNVRNASHWKTKAAIQRLGHKPTLEDLGGDPVAVMLVVSAKPKGVLPDRQNCASAVKAHIDGMADALGINDRHFDAVRVTFDDTREGWMRIELGGDT